jgi:hypothetical protein
MPVLGFKPAKVGFDSILGANRAQEWSYSQIACVYKTFKTSVAQERLKTHLWAYSRAQQ